MMEHEVRILRQSVRTSFIRLYELRDEYSVRTKERIGIEKFLNKILNEKDFAESLVLNVIANQKLKV